MATSVKIAAKKHNASLSTGPKTPEGKAAAARNATKLRYANAAITKPMPNSRNHAGCKTNPNPDAATRHSPLRTKRTQSVTSPTLAVRRFPMKPLPSGSKIHFCEREPWTELSHVISMNNIALQLPFGAQHPIQNRNRPPATGHCFLTKRTQHRRSARNPSFDTHSKHCWATASGTGTQSCSRILDSWS
jgi:hypothetical protein